MMGTVHPLRPDRFRLAVHDAVAAHLARKQMGLPVEDPPRQDTAARGVQVFGYDPDQPTLPDNDTSGEPNYGRLELAMFIAVLGLGCLGYGLRMMWGL